MRRGLEQLGALDQGFAHELELKLLEIAQPAMDQLGRGRGGGRRVVALLGEHDFQPAARGVAGDGRAMDAAADDEKIEALRGHVGGRLGDAGAEQIVDMEDAHGAAVLDDEQGGDASRR